MRIVLPAIQNRHSSPELKREALVRLSPVISKARMIKLQRLTVCPPVPLKIGQAPQ